MNEYVALFEKNDPNALPEGLVRVNAENSDCAVLVFGSEKVALMDCGLAFVADKTIENIEKALAEKGRDKVDYLFVSHTHYDHVGALPYIVEKWPEIQVVGSAKAQYVFTRPGAIKVMRELGAAAAKDFGGIDDFEPKTDGLRVDIVLTDGETITL
ncbi:MAG: MBL fold metallo-hydrolase [Firmicutes bacterium]|nr:MBL fold metallo-hydrolase [Bacillota bacterium]